MSPQLHARCALAVLAAALAACAMGLLAWGPVAPGPDLHAFGMAADGWTVSALAFLLVAPGVAAAWFGWRSAHATAHRMWRHAWRAFFAVSALAVAVAALDHLLPNAMGQLLVSVPAASACAVVSLLFVAERLGRAWIAPPALAAALLAGPVAGVACWMAQVVTGAADVRMLLWVQALPLLMIPLGVWGLRSRGLSSLDWLVALALLCVAEATNWAGPALSRATGSHAAIEAVHHLALAATLAWMAHALARQMVQPRQAAASDLAGMNSSQRSTSPSTSGR